MQRLTYEESYRCPACGSGDLRAIALMDAFGCSFCQQMFTANLNTQSVHLEGGVQPMAWKWDGWKWRSAHQSETAEVFIWGFSSALAMTPVSLIILGNYIFPPLEGSSFPVVWSLLTLACHGLMAGLLLAEYHRWPWYISSQIRFQRWRQQMFNQENALN
ncbi:MAG: hypothetical protein AB8B99_03230 [Phormidesmis sp.]